MGAHTLLVLGDEETVDGVEAALSDCQEIETDTSDRQGAEAPATDRQELVVRRVADLDALFAQLCHDVVHALLLPSSFDGASGGDVARGVRGLYPDLPIIVAGGADDASGVTTVEATAMTDDGVTSAVAAALTTDVESAAARPPSRLETLAMSMFDGFTDHLFAKDAAGRHVLTGGRTFGLDAVIGRTDRAIDVGLDESVRKSLADDEHVVSSGESVVEHEEYTAGENEHTLTTKVPWYDADGSVVGLAGISRDITNRKRQERALRRQNERLTKIAIVAAHELRNELQVASGRLPLVRDDPAHLEVVDESLDRLETIVDDVVTLATAARRPADEETEWLSTPVREVWQSLDVAEATLDVIQDRLVVADPRAIRLFFEILLSNAVEHGGADVAVTVGGTDDGFYVADDGAGIQFDPPERVLDAGFSAAGRDAGFGLYVARRIAADHGWTLGVGDPQSGGARFDVDGVASP